MQFLVSAGEASGDLYAAGVVERLRARYPAAQFFGCAGPRLQSAGVEPIVDAANLSVVGLAEVVHHLPRIYGEYRKLAKTARARRPVAALLTDSPDFHLRLARHLRRAGVPVYYLVAPQVWAWRQGRVKAIRALVDQLFCLFPFEEPWFRERGVNATYIGHPLANLVRRRLTRDEFFAKYGLRRERKLVVLLPGSRAGEARRHMETLLETAALLRARGPVDVGGNVILATPKGFAARGVFANFREPIEAQSIQIVENDTWDAIGHADVALAASGTVTIEAAILGTPMVTFYKVMALSWWAGRRLVKVPYLSMVNLIAGREIVPEFMQQDMTAENLARAVEKLLTEPEAAAQMRSDLQQVREALSSEGDPLERAAAQMERELVGRLGGE